MFKIGDILVGRESSNLAYGITSQENNVVLKVLRVKTDALYCQDDILVEVLASKRGNMDVGFRFWVMSKHFMIRKDNSVTMKRLKEIGCA